MKKLRGISWVAVLLAGMSIGGCASPPSVVLLLRSVERVLDEEQRLVREDAARQVQQIQQTLMALQQAFEQDLRAQSTLTPEWVLEATAVYVAACQELVRHQMELDRQYQQRQENLQLARQAQERAVSLLEKQDELIERVLGVEGWRLLGRVDRQREEE